MSALTTRNGYFGTSSWTLHFDSGPTALWWIPTCSTPIDQRDYGTAHTTPIRRIHCAGYTEDHLGSTSALWSRSYCKWLLDRLCGGFQTCSQYPDWYGTGEEMHPTYVVSSHFQIFSAVSADQIPLRPTLIFWLVIHVRILAGALSGGVRVRPPGIPALCEPLQQAAPTSDEGRVTWISGGDTMILCGAPP